MLSIKKFTDNVDYEFVVQDKHFVVICKGRSTIEVNRIYLDRNLRINTLKSGNTMIGLSFANSNSGITFDILKSSKLQISINSTDNQSSVKDGSLHQMRVITNNLPQTAYANDLLEELFELLQDSIGIG